MLDICVITLIDYNIMVSVWYSEGLTSLRNMLRKHCFFEMFPLYVSEA